MIRYFKRCSRLLETIEHVKVPLEAQNFDGCNLIHFDHLGEGTIIIDSRNNYYDTLLIVGLTVAIL